MQRLQAYLDYEHPDCESEPETPARGVGFSGKKFALCTLFLCAVLLILEFITTH
jgi:hypothetical protein